MGSIQRDMPNLAADSPIRELDLPASLTDKLLQLGFDTVGSVVIKTPQQMEALLTTRSSKQPAIAILEANLYEHGLFLGESFESQLQRPEIRPSEAELNRPIETFTRSERALTAFHTNGIYKARDVAKMNYFELLDHPGLGATKVREMARRLSDVGIRLSSIRKQTEAYREELPEEVKPISITREAVTEPMLIGDTIQMAGAVFMLPTPKDARAFRDFARAKLDQAINPEEAGDFQYAVKHIGVFEGQPAVYIQKDALAKIENGGLTLERQYEQDSPHMPKVHSR